MPRMQALLVEPAGDLVHLQPVADIEIEDPAHHAGFGFVDLEAGSACLGLPDQAVSVGRAREHVQRALAGTMDLAATRALGDLRTLVFGDHRQDLAQQHPVGCRVVRLLDAPDRRAGAGELLLQQDLVREVAAQPVDRPDQHGLDLAAGDAVTQRVKRRTLKGRAAEPVVGEHEVVGNRPAEAAAMVENRLTLTGDRLALALGLARHPQVGRDRRGHCRRWILHRSLASSWTSFVRGPGIRRLRKAAPGRHGRRPGACEQVAFSRASCPARSRPPASSMRPGCARCGARACAAGRARDAGCAP